jgi:hypothetical protein
MPTQTLSAHVAGLSTLNNTNLDPTADSLLVYDSTAATNKIIQARYIGAGEHTVNLLASGMVARTTNGPSAYSAEKATNDVMVSGYGFDAATEEAIQIMIPLPKGFNSGGSIIAKFYWSSAATAGTGDVVWGIRLRYSRNDDAIDQAFGTGQTVTDSFIADGDTHVTSETSAITPGGTYAAECVLVAEVYRSAAAGGDTYTQDALLLACMISLPYSVNSDD